MSSRSSDEALIGDTVNWNEQLTQIKSNAGFWGEEKKPEYPERENLSVQSRELTNSTHIWRRIWKSNPGHISGRRVLSPHRRCVSAVVGA